MVLTTSTMVTVHRTTEPSVHHQCLQTCIALQLRLQLEKRRPRVAAAGRKYLEESKRLRIIIGNQRRIDPVLLADMFVS